MKSVFIKFLSILLALIMSISLCACDGSKKEEPTKRPQGSPPPISENGYYGVGDVINIDNIVYTVLSAQKSYGRGLQERVNEGYIFISIEFQVENFTGFDFGLGSIGLFSSCDNVSIKSQDLMARRVFGDRAMPGKLKNGEIQTFTACYRVPEDFKVFQIDFAILVLKSMQVGVKISAEDFELVELSN